MLCRAARNAAAAPLPEGFRFRLCRPDELTTWMAMQFDSEADAVSYRPYMQAWYERVYAPRGQLFFKRCTFACDEADTPVATAFTYPTVQGIMTFHWLKVLRSHEGLGIGRAIVGHVMDQIDAGDYPVLLHTHPTSQRALKLYSDFGFDLLVDTRVGSRTNDLDRARTFLEQTMTSSAYSALRFTHAPAELLDRFTTEQEPEF